MFGFFENEQTKKVKSHLMNLAALAKADGHIDEREMSFIVAVGKKNGMRADEVRSIVANTGGTKMLIPENDSERFDQIFDLVDMMLADGVVDDHEMDFCINMAEKLGFRKAIVGVLVRKISMGVKDGLPREQIKEDSQAFLNYNDSHL
ncbi:MULTISPECIES: tellurite resistance TerB family protein [Hymenobacter]|uniref:TerB family tellurite resistance protein n=1 Tax=Hymenobacter jejuensis TaxID=2502781 RepID=A0A5B8A2U5_9BACT|nr:MULTISPECIES: TerB family tellurite resistance protein [Hymenobacter]MBC6989473.1 TerB family tellurite resistance protein [Hymenobacter sp. BT491]QDA61499.1 TerB family tellurite resistance protein [Hymenobacter jejuensis]